MQDRIVHVELSPEKSANSIRDWVPENLFTSDLKPVPADSSAHTHLDIDSDGTLDFRISTEHWTESFPSASNPFVYPTALWLIPLHPEALLNKPDSANGFLLNMPQGSQPPIESVWVSGRAYGYLNYEYYQENYFTDTYWAIKVNGMSGWIHIARDDYSAFIVDQYAYNTTAGRPLAMGRTE